MLQFSSRHAPASVSGLRLSWADSFSMYCFYYPCHPSLPLTAVSLSSQTLGSGTKYVTSSGVQMVSFVPCSLFLVPCSLHVAKLSLD